MWVLASDDGTIDKSGPGQVTHLVHPELSGELQFDLAGLSAYGTNDDLDVMAQPGDQLQQFRFADTAKQASGDTQHLGLVDAEQCGGTFLR